MDDMSKYLTALGEGSQAAAKIDSYNAAMIDQTSAFNAKLRNAHSEIMGATDPVGIATVAKGLSKIGRGTYYKAGFSEAYDDFAAGGLRGVVSGAVNRSIGGNMDDLLQRGQARLANPDSIEPGQSVDMDTGLTAEESSQLDGLVAQSKLASSIAPPAETSVTPAEPAASASVGEVETATTTAEASTESSLAAATAGSTADDWNPIGLLTTIGLGLATLFAGIFGHKKEQVARHAQSMTLNPSTQFGV